MTSATAGAGSRVVVGVDGSEPSKAALRWAVRIAGLTSSRIVAVTAWDYPITYGFPVQAEGWDPAADAELVVRTTLDEVFGATPPAGLETHVQRGHASDVLLQASDGAEMLVVGSRGHGGFAGLLLGSVSATCAEHARCPVLVVHGTT
jgi:nucleotide-binding universal stress UspA family protein